MPQIIKMIMTYSLLLSSISGMAQAPIASSLGVSDSIHYPIENNQTIIVQLNNDDMLKGILIYQNEKNIALNTQYKNVTIAKKHISNIEISDENKKEDEFLFSEISAIEVFSDATGSTLKSESGLLAGFNVYFPLRDDLLVTVDIKSLTEPGVSIPQTGMKYRFLNIENWQRRFSSSIGYKFAPFWLMTNFDKYEENALQYCRSDDHATQPNTCVYKNHYVPLTYDANNPVASNDLKETNVMMLQLYGATSYAKMFNNLNSAFQLTLGGDVRIVKGAYAPRVYVMSEIDLNKYVKVTGKLYYAPYINPKYSPVDASKDLYFQFGTIVKFNDYWGLGVNSTSSFFNLYIQGTISI